MAGKDSMTARTKTTTPNHWTWLTHTVFGCPVEYLRLIRDRDGLSVPIPGSRRLLRCPGCGVYHELPTVLAVVEAEAVGPPPGVA